MSEDLGFAPQRRDYVLHINMPPTSHQAPAPARVAYGEAVRSLVADVPFVIVGDVRLTVEWFVSLQDRYETDATPDVDNILKPLLDSLSGRHGLLVDDCQVQSVSSSWLDANAQGQQQHTVSLNYDADDAWPRELLSFVQVGNGLCFPYRTDTPAAALQMILSHLEMVLEKRAKMLDLGVSHSDASRIMPIQRFFHRSRVRDFPVMHLAELRASIE